VNTVMKLSGSKINLRELSNILRAENFRNDVGAGNWSVACLGVITSGRYTHL
jgi:hypothetical protein